MSKSPKKRCTVPLVMAALGFVVSTALGQTTNAIPDTYRLPSSAADTTKPGFVWRVHQVTSAQPNSSARTESQLAGELGANVADPNAQGIAIAVTSPPSPDTAPITFEIEGVLNLSRVSSDLGNFPADDQMPGIPGTTGSTDYIAAEVTTWLDLPAGVTTFGVSSDDGFVMLLGGPLPADQLAAIKVGEYEGGRGVGDTVMNIKVATAGLYAVRIAYENGTGDANIEFWSLAADRTTKVLVNDAANGGIKAYRAVTGGVSKAYARKVVPAAGASGVAPNTRIQVELVDGTSPIDPATAKLALDGTQLSVAATKAGNVTTLNYLPATLFAGGSTHQAMVTYTDGGTPISLSWSFKVAQYGLLTPAMKVTPDTSKPGFVWTVFANDAANQNSIRRAESALAGLLSDAEGNPFPNLADPAAQGAAIAASTAPSPANAPIKFEIAGVINLSLTAGGTEGNASFGADKQMPGIPATGAGTGAATDGIAAEILTYIELPAGMVGMGVNSDDNFRTLGGAARDAAGAVVMGERDPINGGSAETTFFMLVQEAGVYAFRTVYEQGTATANIEWFTLKTDGTKVLINDVANGGVKAYRAVSTPTAPYVRMVEPPIAPRQLNVVRSNLTVVVEDGTAAVADSSVALTVDGKSVTVTKTRQGKDLVVIYTPTGLFIPDEEHSAVLTYKDSAGASLTAQWKFRNLKNIVLPTAVLTENFDSYEEGKAPTGWNAWNFTDVRTPGEDLDNLNSDTYLGWVVIARSRMETLKSRVFNWVEGSQVVNGVAIDSTTFCDGNLLYAETDVRGGNQVQFIISKPFDLSKVTNVVMSFSSLYEQNQDNIGAVEYSVDGGKTFMPVVYYLDFQDGGGDIKYFVDGTIDAVTTMTAPNADTANWIENGVPRGDKYGDGIAAPITQALAAYIAPRWNDNSTEGKRVEVFRLPAASKQADVRLRLAQLGTGSWYFGVDNIAFYEGPAPATPPASAKLAISASGANVTISWTGTGTLQEATSVSGIWTASSSQANPQTIVASGTKFYRISQ